MSRGFPQHIDSLKTFNFLSGEADASIVKDSAKNKEKDTSTVKKSKEVNPAKQVSQEVKDTLATINSPLKEEKSVIEINHHIIVPYAALPLKDNSYSNIPIPFDSIPKGLKLIAIDGKAKPKVFVRTNYSKSLFVGHLLKAKNNEPFIRNVIQNDWFAIQVVFLIFLLASLRTFYQKRFSLVLTAFFNKQYASQIFREENALTQRASLLLSLMFLISASLFFYQIDDSGKLIFGSYSGFQKYLSILIVVFLFYSIKFILNRVGGYLFKCQKETNEYIFNQFLVLQIIGLGLMLVVVFLSYLKVVPHLYLINCGWGILLTGFLVRLLRSGGIAANNKAFSGIYIFLYLCTLEILPVVLIAKYLTS